MALHWKKDIREQPANTILLLEDVHFRYLSRMAPQENFALILKAYPHLAWYIRHKMPELESWVQQLQRLAGDRPVPEDLEQLVGDVMEQLEDWILYVTTPDDYHNQPFMSWDETELTTLADYTGKIVVDVGSGTGKQAFAAAPLAKAVYCVEPVWNLRRYLKNRADQESVRNLFVVDGVIERIPFDAEFADITQAGHVVGEDIACEMAELERITKRGGMIILCPGNIDADNHLHRQLVEWGYYWARFLEPGESSGCGYKRKYWKRKASSAVTERELQASDH